VQSQPTGSRRDGLCDAAESKAIVEGLIRNNWESNPSFLAPLARGLLGQDSKGCAPAKYFDTATIAKLTGAAAK
jgi:hypothetical protein